MKDWKDRNTQKDAAGDNADIDRESTRRGAMRILEALSGVEDELLERSEDREIKSAKRLPMRYSRAWAAVLCLAVAGAMSWGGYRLTMRVEKSGGSSADNCMPEAAEESGAAPADTAGFAEGGEVAAEQKQDDYNGQSTDDAGVRQEDLGGGVGTWEEAEGTIDSDGEKRASGQSMGAGSGESGGMPSTESAQEAAGEESLDMSGCPALNAVKYSLEEARGQKLVGDYIPETVPQGYTFESAGSNLDMTETNLRVTWSRGMDFITWDVVQVREAPETVDIEKTESYDKRLYEIPYAESVPEEYRQSMDNPVFAWEDFSLETVRSRMISYEDSGDTDTPRGSFSVLYPDNIIVHFSGRGTAEEIWEMFGSMAMR